MPEHHVFLALPNELYHDAVELARLRHLTLSDLLVEALSNSLELQRRSDWALERTPPHPYPHTRTQ